MVGASDMGRFLWSLDGMVSGGGHSGWGIGRRRGVVGCDHERCR